MIEDLSRYHHPVGNLFARSGNSVDWDRYRLSEEQLAFFRENGYLKGVRILSDEQVEALVRSNTKGRVLGFLGEPRVNVLTLNLAVNATG